MSSTVFIEIPERTSASGTLGVTNVTFFNKLFFNNLIDFLLTNL